MGSLRKLTAAEKRRVKQLAKSDSKTLGFSQESMFVILNIKHFSQFLHKACDFDQGEPLDEFDQETDRSKNRFEKKKLLEFAENVLVCFIEIFVK